MICAGLCSGRTDSGLEDSPPFYGQAVPYAQRGGHAAAGEKRFCGFVRVQVPADEKALPGEQRFHFPMGIQRLHTLACRGGQLPGHGAFPAALARGIVKAYGRTFTADG